MQRAAYKDILFLVAYWTACAFFIARYDQALMKFVSAPAVETSNFARDTAIVVLITALSGVLVAAGDVVLLSRSIRKKPFGVTLLARTAFYLACIFVFTSLSGILLHMATNSLAFADPAVWSWYSDYMTSPRVLMIFGYWGLAVMSGLFILMVSQKFGQGVLVHFLIGKYHRPREEERIFMFLDLKSSTTHAERLGHVTFSRLIQDCFFDLTDVVTRHRAVVYQYVGDEAVLTWRPRDGFRQANCIRLFFAYDDALRTRSSYYEREYGFVPEFKAGVHAGLVTAAEVGEIKKELAYHGDVLNTAARIQGTCNKLDARILVSAELKALLGEIEGLEFGFAGEIKLRGREKPARLFRAIQTRLPSQSEVGPQRMVTIPQ